MEFRNCYGPIAINHSFEITDITGRIVNLPFSNTANGIIADASNLEAGIFFARVVNDNGRVEIIRWEKLTN